MGVTASPYTLSNTDSDSLFVFRFRWKFVFKNTADESVFAVRGKDGIFKEVEGGHDRRKKTYGRRKL